MATLAPASPRPITSYSVTICGPHQLEYFKHRGEVRASVSHSLAQHWTYTRDSEKVC